jgi:pimeloyl-ACP methyl ester carboxylesterase
VTNPPFKRRRDAIKEVFALARQGWLIPRPGRSHRTHGEAEHLVVFVHGFCASAGVFNPMAEHLARHGMAPRQLHFGYPPTGSVAEHAERLAGLIERAHPEGPVCVVAHSLGGLISRYCVQVLGQRIDALVTLGTPHRGTSLARVWPLTLTRELSPDSTLLRTLDATRSRLQETRVTSIVALQDVLVPVRSAVFDGARCVYIDGVGHHGVLFHHRAWQTVEEGIRLGRRSIEPVREEASGEHLVGVVEARRHTG